MNLGPNDFTNRKVPSGLMDVIIITAWDGRDTLSELERGVDQDSAEAFEEQLKTDKELVEKIVRGDERAFRQMYRAYSPGLLRRLMQWLGNAQQAEDCLQQVFLEALRSFKRYRGEGKLSSWLHRIATNVVMDLFRKNKRIKSLMERVTPPADADPADSSPPIPETLFLREEVRELVHDVLNKLSAQKRMAILLCDMEGLALEQAASQMGVPPGTVGSRLYHGRREFQKKAEMECRLRGLSLHDLMIEQ